MKKLPLVLSVGSVALLLGGCPASEPTNQSQPLTQESPVPSPTPSPPAAVPPTFPGATKPAPAIEGRSQVAGLIPSTDPDAERAKVTRGRPDPTALLKIQPEISFEIQGKTAPVARPLPRSRFRLARLPMLPRPPVATAPAPRGPVAPPPLPPPTAAQGVVVSGIVQLPTTSMAIVKAPGDRTERRVVPGSTLADGAVLVKQIDTNPDDPSVTLEQFGQTVVKRLGAGIASQPAVAPNAPAMKFSSEGNEEGS